MFSTFKQLMTLVLYPGYGLTEMSPSSLILPQEWFLSKAGSAGVLVPNLEARLVRDDGVDVKPGEPGELWLRGPTVMKVDVFPFRFSHLIGCVLRAT